MTVQITDNSLLIIFKLNIMKKYFTALVTFLILITASTNAQVNFDNQVIVYFKSGIQRNGPSNTTATISSANILNVLSTYGIPTVNVVPSFPAFIEADTVITGSPKFTTGLTGEDSRQMNRAKVFSITITNAVTKQNFINSLNAMSEVLYAETNGGLTTNIIPVDGRFNQQWGMRNLTVPGADIHLDGATNIFTGNPNSIIAIIDNGVDRVHNDLDAKILGGDNGFQILVDGLGRQFSHGSHVAGIAAAISNNAGNNGVAGVDWQARIHPKNIFDGNGDPDITQSIIDAVNFSANVWTFNNSWGTRNQDGTPGRYSVTIRSAFAQAYRNNRVSCIAMGNHQLTNPNVVSFPAGINSGVLAVGATDDHDNIANFSAQGPHIDVSAPGVGIVSTNFNNGYIDLSGTSMATPHVAGLASLLKGFNTNLANDDIEQIVRLTADDANAANGFPGFDNQMGTGRINAQRALQSLQAPNTLQQLNTTAGTIFSTSTSLTRVFLGFPGLPDAAYVVKRSEVRKAITLPTMCSTIGVWGRGVGTTGYREENGRSFGEGICEVVPGTLTSAGCTLRTWIYEVWSVNGQYLGFYPRAANNVVFQYTILGVTQPFINGDDLFCTTSNPYTISNLPGNTVSVNWNTTPAGIAQPNTPNANQTTLTRITNGAISLSAVITNGCGIGQNFTAVKAVNSGTYPQPQYINTIPDVCPQYGVNTNPIGGATYTWSFYKQPYSNNLQSFPNSGSNKKLNINTGTGTYNIGVTADNACGSSPIFFITVPITCGSGHLAVISPNPSTGNVTISTSITTQNKLNAASDFSAQTKIYQIKVLDQLGTLLKQYSFKSGTTTVNINLSNLVNGTYTVKTYDNITWDSQQLIILK